MPCRTRARRSPPPAEVDSGRTSWTAQERDGAGEYSALYVMPKPDRILKRKLTYFYMDGVAGAPSDAAGRRGPV